MEKYKIQKCIGKGAFGTAHLCKHRQSGKVAVLKKVNLGELPESMRESALLEVQLLSRLKHPFIVAYFDSFIEKKILCIVMEYCDNGDLTSKIQERKTPFSEEQILKWFVQVALALSYCHKRKVLHRDVKASNLFLTSGGIVKLGDFGISKVLSSDTDFARTMIGTPYYLSPEVLEHKPYRDKSDVWALGCVLVELATLKHAFEARALPELVNRIVTGNTPTLPTTFTANFRSLIASMLSKNPDDRPSFNKLLSLRFVEKYVLRYRDSLPNGGTSTNVENWIGGMEHEYSNLRREINSNLSKTSTAVPSKVCKSEIRATPESHNSHESRKSARASVEREQRKRVAAYKSARAAEKKSEKQRIELQMRKHRQAMKAVKPRIQKLKTPTGNPNGARDEVHDTRDGSHSDKLEIPKLSVASNSKQPPKTTRSSVKDWRRELQKECKRKVGEIPIELVLKNFEKNEIESCKVQTSTSTDITESLREIERQELGRTKSFLGGDSGERVSKNLAPDSKWEEKHQKSLSQSLEQLSQSLRTNGCPKSPTSIPQPTSPLRIHHASDTSIHIGDQRNAHSPVVPPLSRSTVVKGKSVSSHIETAKQYCVDKLGTKLFKKVFSLLKSTDIQNSERHVAELLTDDQKECIKHINKIIFCEEIFSKSH
eukprot:173110_1